MKKWSTSLDFAYVIVFIIIFLVPHTSKGENSVETRTAKRKSSERYAAYAHTWNLALFAGSGYPLKEGDFPYHFELSYGLPFGSRLESGFYLGNSTASVTDTVKFPETGYKEDRIYDLTALGGGFKVQFRLNRKLSLFANAGMTRTASNLKKVDTTAPIPSTLKLGPQEGEVYSFAYRTGINYEYLMGSFSVGGTAAYSSSASKEEAKIEDLTVGAFLKYYRKSSKAESAPANSPPSDSWQESEIQPEEP